jgi:alkanesulfonate monooxygenase SsuD/methylene tetrahydromethanopterin reductase-like flavin-dependent oxidoreductase (luciferase family)
MTPRIGYLLPTRERIMEGREETASLLALAERAEGLGFASVWVGDSLTARPRHEPLSLLAAVAARTRRVEMGTAVMLPALRNPVLLAHQVATIDRIAEGRLILGVGIATDVANIRAEFAACGVPFEQRGARMMEGLRLCRALWRGEEVDWDGRWTLRGQRVGPTPHRPGGPPLWLAGSRKLALQRIARELDGWFPNDSEPARWAEVRGDIDTLAREAGRDPAAIAGAAYLTLALEDDAAAANARLDAYLERYYGQPAAALRRRQVCYAGPAAGAGAWLAAFAAAGAEHLVLRFAGDHERHQDSIARICRELGWH